MLDQVNATPTPHKRLPWDKSKLTGAKPPLRPKHVWSIWTTLQIEGPARDLTMFNLAIDNKLRGSNLAHERRLCAISGRSDLLALAPSQTLVVGAPFSSLLANHHRLPGYKRLDARTAKSRLAHPIGALRPAVTEPGVGPQQHIQA